MLTTRLPGTWQELETDVEALLRQCGLAVQQGKTIATVRGAAAVDVYAEDSTGGRKHIILCECKRWGSAVPQTVVHAFRTVVADSGANVGYLISSGGFQSGAYKASEQSNVRLVTWLEFQMEFEPTWIEKYLRPTVASEFDVLMTYTEPLPPNAYQALGDSDRRRFDALETGTSGLGGS